MKYRKIVVAPDSFKGSLSAREVADCCRDAIRRAMPSAETVCVPLADGGEGTVDAVCGQMGGEMAECSVHGPLGRSVKARYAITGDGSTAVMEMAQASGLTLIEASERNPLLTSTCGVGEMIVDALDRGCRKIYMGLGGSATCDGGAGMLSALGCRLIDAEGNELQGRGIDMERVCRIDMSGIDKRIAETEFVAACDVDNPFYGANGAAFVFAPQKGASHDDVVRLDNGLRDFSRVIAEATGVDVSEARGAGAAGGLGGAFMAFLRAEMKPGIEMVLDAVGFDTIIEDADLILTGEGSIDRQSLMGKAVSGVLKRGIREGIPVVAFAGSVSETERLEEAGFCAVFSVMQRACSLEEAMRRDVAEENIRTAVCQLMRFARLGI